jgi:hypothetical protein
MTGALLPDHPPSVSFHERRSHPASCLRGGCGVDFSPCILPNPAERVRNDLSRWELHLV